MVLKIISGSSHPELARRTAKFLNTPLADVSIGQYPDGECNVKVNSDVRGSDVFIIQPTCPPVNHNIMELFILMDCLRRASANRITAVLPYFGYARQDRKHEGRVPISAKLMANLITEAGCHRCLTIDLHAGQIQGFFDIPVDHLYARDLFIDHLKTLNVDNAVAMSPDLGAIQMARSYASRLGITFGTVDKRRISPEKVESGYVIGDVEGKDVILIDDMISTGGSMVDACNKLKGAGAQKIYICATHGLFSGNALEKFANAPIEQVIITDTIPPKADLPENFKVLTVSRLIGEAILRIHTNQSLSALFDASS